MSDGEMYVAGYWDAIGHTEVFVSSVVGGVIRTTTDPSAARRFSLDQSNDLARRTALSRFRFVPADKLDRILARGGFVDAMSPTRGANGDESGPRDHGAVDESPVDQD